MRVVTFGEIMLRIEPLGFKRFRQTLPGNLECTFGGSEANVAVSLAYLGMNVSYVTSLPSNVLGDACVGNLKNLGVDTSYVVRTNKGRFGIYFVEKGANQRPSQVIYDREGSSFSLTDSNKYDWENIFKAAEWFHISGITPAVSNIAAEAAIKAVQMAKHKNITVSIDLNYRKKLWRWKLDEVPRDLARKTIKEILPYVDIVFGNEEDAYDFLDIKAGDTDVGSGKLDIARYAEVASKIVEMYPNVSKVGFTLRESISASHNNWGAMLYDARSKEAFFAPQVNGVYEPYEIKNIIDRVGAGDSFSAGVIYALNNSELKEPSAAVLFGVTASCLNHSIQGDFNFSSKDEILSIMHGNVTGRVKR